MYLVLNNLTNNGEDDLNYLPTVMFRRTPVVAYGPTSRF